MSHHEEVMRLAQKLREHNTECTALGRPEHTAIFVADRIITDGEALKRARETLRRTRAVLVTVCVALWLSLL